MSDERNQPGVPAFRNVGLGHQTSRLCMGCNKPRNTIGSSGSGVRWRCLGCIEARKQRKAE
jgi:hypothetical protein